MSKMPAKKKSCFQITSVTQAQVAAIGAADDIESLDDPDESRTEDVSSEIYDMSRAEYDPGCDRSSSEEALNNVGEPEAISVMALSHAPQPGQMPVLSSMPLGEFRKAGVPGSNQGVQHLPGITIAVGLPLITQPGVMQQQSSPGGSTGLTIGQVNTPQHGAVNSSPAPATSTVSCTSRFRVIKLDHGIGEPFRRGRWTCTEFYEKDSDSSAVGRTADSIRHASVLLDPAADRDSGLGHTGGSVISPSTHSGQGLGSVAEATHSSPRMHSVETLTQQQQQMNLQNYNTRSQGVSGSATQSSFSSGKPTTVPAQTTLGSFQPSAPQSLLPIGQNGQPQSTIHTQKSPIMPPSAQPVTYHPQQQHLMAHHLTSQLEYYQQQQPTSMQPGPAIGQSLPLSSFLAGQQPLVLPPGGTTGLSQVGDVSGAGSVCSGQSAPGLLQQTGGMGGVGGSILTGASNSQQQTVNQYAATGQPQPHSLHPTFSSVQNVPVTAVNPSVPVTVPTAVPSASSVAMPNLTTSSLPPGQQPHSKLLLGLGVPCLPATGFGHVEGGGVKSEDPVNTQSALVSGKEEVQPLIPESLQLTTPTVNSLFGIHIPVDGDADRNPSKAFYQAFQSGTRLRDSKALSDRSSGTNVAAIDNKIEQAMDLVKSHLMYAVREEVEVLKEQIKELCERNSVLERENAVLKSLANNEQLSQLSTQSTVASSAATQQPSLSQLPHHPNPQQLQTQLDPSQQLQPNVTSA